MMTEKQIKETADKLIEYIAHDNFFKDPKIAWQDCYKDKYKARVASAIREALALQCDELQKSLMLTVSCNSDDASSHNTVNIGRSVQRFLKEKAKELRGEE